jgi:hypothetical protein
VFGLRCVVIDTILTYHSLNNNTTNSVNVSKAIVRSKRDQLLVSTYIPQPLMFYNGDTDKRWIRPVGLDQLCTVLKVYDHYNTTNNTNSITTNNNQNAKTLSNTNNTDSTDSPASKVQLVGGNTSIGVTKYYNNTAPYNVADEYNVFVDVNAVPEMVGNSFDTSTGAHWTCSIT